MATSTPGSVVRERRGGGNMPSVFTSRNDGGGIATGGYEQEMTQYHETTGYGMTDLTGGGGPAGGGSSEWGSEDWGGEDPSGFIGGVDTDFGGTSGSSTHYDQLASSNYQDFASIHPSLWGQKAPAGGDTLDPGTPGFGSGGSLTPGTGEFGPGGSGGYGGMLPRPPEHQPGGELTNPWDWGTKPWDDDTLDDPGFGSGGGTDYPGPPFTGEPDIPEPGTGSGYAGMVGTEGNVNVTPPYFVGGAPGYSTTPTLFQGVGGKLCNPNDPNCYGKR